MSCMTQGQRVHCALVQCANVRHAVERKKLYTVLLLLIVDFRTQLISVFIQCQ